jgi:hypothetical protein
MRLTGLRSSVWFALALLAIASLAVYYALSSSKTELPTLPLQQHEESGPRKTGARVKDFITPYKGPDAPLGSD